MLQIVTDFPSEVCTNLNIQKYFGEGEDEIRTTSTNNNYDSQIYSEL